MPLEAEIVRHPGSVVVVPVADDGALVLVRQYRHAVGRHVWELPAGTLKPGEEPESAAMRECQEEIGLIAGRLDSLGAYYPTPGYCDEVMHFYRATGLRRPGPGDPEAHADADEDIETRAFDRDAAARDDCVWRDSRSEDDWRAGVAAARVIQSPVLGLRPRTS